MSILERTIKIVGAFSLATWLALAFNLSFATSAGIIAILSLLDTRRSSLIMALRRVLSAIIALGIGTACFLLIGNSLVSFGLYLSLYVPIAYRFNLQNGIAPSSVLVAHLWSVAALSSDILGNELFLLIIGTGSALLFNAYMSSHTRAIRHYQSQVEHLLKEALLEISTALEKNTPIAIQPTLNTLQNAIQQAIKLVYQERDNQLFNQTNYEVHYFEMRDNQLKILKQMVRHLHFCQLDLAESKILAGLFYWSADQLSETYSAIPLMENITEMLAYFRQRPLPQTRQEFEERAILFQLLNDFRYFIQLKVDFYTNYKDSF